MIMPRFFLSFLFCLLLAGGCATRDYDLTEAENRGLLPEDTILADWNVDREWWKSYADPRLDALVSQALTRNTDLARSAISVNRALYQARKVGADLVPAFSADAGAGTTSNLDSGDASRSYSAGLDVGYELDLWGRLRNAASAAVWEYEATEEDRESARLALINNVVDGYYQLAYLRHARLVTAENLDFCQEVANIVEARYKAGTVDSLDPVTARQSVLAARNSLTELDTDIKTAEQTLRDLLNLGPETALPPTDADLPTIPVPQPNLDVPLAALSLRPDVRAAEYRILAAFRDLEAQRAALWPSVTLGGSLSFNSSEADTLFDVPLLGGTVRLNLPFLDWNSLRWNIRISEADFKAARLDFEQTVTSALNEVDAARFHYLNTLTLLDNTLKKHEADVAIAQYRETRYKAGSGELKDWLEARSTANNSMLSALKAKYDVIRYGNTIYKVMGGRLTARE